MTVKLQAGGLYITAGGYVVEMCESYSMLQATLETSPGTDSLGSPASKAISKGKGWYYYSDGRITGLSPEWKEKLTIVAEAPFDKLPDLPEGFRWKDGYPQFRYGKVGELILNGKKVESRIWDTMSKYFIVERIPKTPSRGVGDGYRELEQGEEITKDCEYRRNNEGEWCPVQGTIGSKYSHSHNYLTRKPINTHNTHLCERSTSSVSTADKPQTQEKEKMTELMNSTKPVLSKVGNLAWRLVKHQTNYWLAEPVRDIACSIGRKVRYVTLLTAIGVGGYAYHDPAGAKDLLKSCLPKVEIKFEKPEILS